ncbi:flagellar biosynthesis repressor FlbT [Sphingomonas sp. TREG-RG-20F-R18-01]|uniref:flagellar biosynthesis repressor FlbT n=1 Tax=Sphingomonas sp. TREG-RG-20F-R18-01 TaxID=2914982 RepID=UPI001F57E69E|nr:flagellar biosynthesis repressor FlbT [Sphingomonas sp. TREG-RG-20F-R18-01]
MRCFALHDGETMIVNGAILRVPVAAQVIVDNEATILRGAAIMPAELAVTPARRLYYACLQAYVGQDVEGNRAQILVDLGALLASRPHDAARAAGVRFANAVAVCDYVGALAECRGLIRQEGVPVRADAAMLAA